MLKNILIIDGNNILNRSFYATQNSTKYNNIVSNAAAYGFLKTYYKFNNIIFPNKTIVCFDKASKTFRNNLYSLYKNNRQKMPEELIKQFILIKKILELMNIQTLELNNFEADDIIGSLCKILKKNNKCFVLSGDKDLFQLIDNNVDIYYINTIKKKSTLVIYNKETFFEKYKFDHKYFVDYKALRGDTSDNIPGVNGIGHIYATKIISKFHTINNIYNNIDVIDINNNIKKKLILDKGKAYLSYNLAKIKTDINVKIDDNIHSNNNQLYNLFNELGFKSLLKKLE